MQAPVVGVAASLPEHIDLTQDELAAFQESIKFADCVPRQLLARTIVARNLEVTSEERDRPICPILRPVG